MMNDGWYQDELAQDALWLQDEAGFIAEEMQRIDLDQAMFGVSSAVDGVQRALAHAEFVENETLAEMRAITQQLIALIDQLTAVRY